MGKNTQIALSVVLTVALAAVFYYLVISSPHTPNFVEPEVRESVSEMPSFQHPLSGQLQDKAEDFFAISVVYDNFTDLKQPGLEQAHIIYEALAEGEITRFLAIFDSNQQPGSVGPIRSARPYLVDWASEYGGVFMHVGGSPQALSQLRAQESMIDIDQIGINERFFYRDAVLKSPHNVFSSYSSWLQMTDQLDISLAQISPWKYFPSKQVPQPALSHQVEIDFFPGNSVGWVYNTEANNYVRFHNSQRQLFATGQQMAADNLIIIAVESRVIDELGRRSMKTTGTGEATVYRNGDFFEARWIKDCESCRMRFLGIGQEEIYLAPGLTWVEVVPSMSLVNFISFSANS